MNSAVRTGDGVISVWYRFANNEASGSIYKWSFSGSTPYEAGGMLVYRGVDPAAPEDGFCGNSGSSTAPTLCSFTTAHSGDTYVGFFTAANQGFVLPSDLTGRIPVRQYSNGVNYGAAAGDKTLVAAGTVPADPAAMNVGGWTTLALALKAGAFP